jgi:hypothetical protein
LNSFLKIQDENKKILNQRGMSLLRRADLIWLVGPFKEGKLEGVDRKEKHPNV